MTCRAGFFNRRCSLGCKAIMRVMARGTRGDAPVGRGAPLVILLVCLEAAAVCLNHRAIIAAVAAAAQLG